MANYEALKTAIRNAVYENGNNEITGQALQDVLKAIVNSLGAGYQFTSVATTETEPGTPDSNVMYIAGAGTYPNFGGTVVPRGSLGIFRYNGEWNYTVLDVASWADASNKLYYNTQAGNVAAKTIQADGFTLQPGGWLKVHFDHANTAANSTLNVNNTGAHIMTFNGRPVSATNSWKAGETVAFYYDNYGVGIWRGIRLVELPDFLNVNDLMGQSTPFASASAARSAIPQQNRKAGLNITYLLTTGENTSQWVQEQFIGDDITDWGVADNWVDYDKEMWTVIGGTTTTEHITESLNVTWAGTGGVIAVENPQSSYHLGEINPTTSYQYTDYIDLSNYASKNALITYLNEVRTNPQANVLVGLCFYDTDKVAISGVPFRGGAQEAGTEENTVSVPANAAFVRFSIRNEHVGQFTASVEYDETVQTGLTGRVAALEQQVAAPITVVRGYYVNSANGELIADTQYNCTEYVAIKPFDKFLIPIFVISRTSIVGLAFFDGNKNYINGIHCPYDAPAGYTFERYIAPPNAAYLRYTLLPNVTPYIKNESQEPIGPYFKTYKAFNTIGHKGGFKLLINFGNGIMLGSCGNNKLGQYDNVLIYRSTDWGFTWTLMGNATQESTLQLQDGLYYGDHDGQGNAVIGSGDLSRHYLLKVTNYGATWPTDYTKVMTAEQINTLLGVTTDGVENVIYCGNNTYRALCNRSSGFSNNAVIESIDGGNTWHTVSSQSPLTASVRSIFRDSKGVIWAAGMLNSSNQGVWKTQDNGLTWERKSTFLAFQSIIEHKGVLYSGAISSDFAEAYVYRSRDDGNTWEKVFTFNDPEFTVKYHRGFISYGNALIAIFGEGEGSSSSKMAWIVTTDDGNHWGLLDRNGSYENGYASLALTIGQTNYINTHSGLYIM